MNSNFILVYEQWRDEEQCRGAESPSGEPRDRPGWVGRVAGWGTSTGVGRHWVPPASDNGDLEGALRQTVANCL